jgi:hypothetical protein
LSTESKPVLDADQLTEAERARHLRLLELRRRASDNSGDEGAGGDEDAAGDQASAVEGASAPSADANQGEELNEFLKELVERRKSRHFQLQLIQDFFENPVEFGVEIDYVPSETPLSEIRSRQKELRYRISLLRTVLEAFEGELSLLDQAERSALSARGEAEGAGGPGGDAPAQRGGDAAADPQAPGAEVADPQAAASGAGAGGSADTPVGSGKGN